MPNLELPTRWIVCSGLWASPMINYTHFKFPGRQQQTFAPGSDIACIARDRLASGIPDEIQHDLSIVAKLDAEPIPPAAAKREKVSPLVIHPCFARYL